MNEKTDAGLRASTLLYYALPAAVLALPTIPVYIYLPALYGVELGLGLATTGLILLAARMFDTVTDPLVGALSDRLHSAVGRRKPWIAVGALVAGLGLFKLLNPPEPVEADYLLTWSMVLYAGWTMFAVPYLAWGAELSRDYDERTRIASWREGMMLAGIVGAGTVAAIATQLGSSELQAVQALAWAAILLGVVVVPLLLWKVPDSSPPASKPTPLSFGRLTRGAALLFSNGPFVRLLSAWFLNGVANGVPAALFFLYMEHGLGAEADERSLLVLFYFAAAIAGIAFWLPLSRRFGKHRVWCWSMIAACLAFGAVPLIPEGGLWVFAAICLVTGLSLGADLVLPPAIQADVVAYDELRSGKARAGLQFAFWGMSTKLALALAVGLALPALELAGFDAAAPEPEEIRTLVVIYSLVPVVIKTIAIAVVWRFPITARKHSVIRRRLDRKRLALNTMEEKAR